MNKQNRNKLIVTENRWLLEGMRNERMGEKVKGNNRHKLPVIKQKIIEMEYIAYGKYSIIS